MADLAERVRRALREEMARKDRSQLDIADLLEWTQSRVTQKLTGRTPITLDELESLCFAVGLSAVETVRDPGLEFCAEMTPTEVRILNYLRHELTQDQVDGMMRMWGIGIVSPQRYAVPVKKPKYSPTQKRKRV